MGVMKKNLMIDLIRSIIADMLLYWVFCLYPDGYEKIELGKFMSGVFKNVNKKKKQCQYQKKEHQKKQ